jgi:hypothetical protein
LKPYANAAIFGWFFKRRPHFEKASKGKIIIDVGVDGKIGGKRVKNGRMRKTKY